MLIQLCYLILALLCCYSTELYTSTVYVVLYSVYALSFQRFLTPSIRKRGGEGWGRGGGAEPVRCGVWGVRIWGMEGIDGATAAVASCL